MKKFFNIILVTLLSIILVVTLILGLAFAFIEGRFVISLDWIVYQNPVNVLIRHILRLVLAITLIIYVIREFVNMSRKKDKSTFSLLGQNIGLVVLGVIMYVNTANYVDIVGLILPLVILAIKLILVFATKFYTPKEKMQDLFKNLAN